MKPAQTFRTGLWLGCLLASALVAQDRPAAQGRIVQHDPIRIQLPKSELWVEVAKSPETRPARNGAAMVSVPTVLRPFAVLVGTSPHRDLRDELLKRGFGVATIANADFVAANPLPAERARLAGAELSKHLRVHDHVARNRLHWVALDGSTAITKVLLAKHAREALTLLEVGGERPVADAPPTTKIPYYRVRIAPGPAAELADAILAAHDLGLPESRAARSALATLNDFHEAATCADQARYFHHFTKDGVFLGTDATERWTKDEFLAWAGFAFERQSAWMFTPFEQHLTVSEDGQFAWFDEQLDSRSYGTCRGSGVLRKVGATWKVAQYNLTVPIPNDLMKGFVEKIRAFEAKQADK